jgi:hypothetical protein
LEDINYANQQINTNIDEKNDQQSAGLSGPCKEISAKFLQGPGMMDSKFIAHQKVGNVPVGSFFFAATLLGGPHNKEGDNDISLIEFGDMFEGLIFQTCTPSEGLDDLQFIFVKQSWLEKCPQSDETGGNFIGETTGFFLNYYSTCLVLVVSFFRTYLIQARF